MGDDYAKRQAMQGRGLRARIPRVARLAPARGAAAHGGAGPRRAVAAEADGYGWRQRRTPPSLTEASEPPELPIEAEDRAPVEASTAIENEEVLGHSAPADRRADGRAKRPPQPRVPRAGQRAFLPRRHDDRHRPAAPRHPRGGEQTLRRTHRAPEPAAFARHALFDSPPRLSGRPDLHPHEP